MNQATLSIKSEAEELMAIYLQELEKPFIREYRFHHVRNWLFDFAHPETKTAIEVDGWGHRTKQRMQEDNEKINTAQSMGWKVYRFTTTEITRGNVKPALQVLLSEI